MKVTAILLLTALVLLSGAIEVIAQDDSYVRAPYRIVFTLDTGIGIPSQPSVFSDLWNSTLPFTVTAGYAPFSWMEVVGTFSYGKWSISEIPAKDAIGHTGIEEVSGGAIATMTYGAMAKFMPFPNLRVLPFAVVGAGFFRASAEDLEVENVLVNKMEGVDGPMFHGGGGLEYAFNENWNVFTEFTWTVCLNGDFKPESLLLNVNQVVDPGAGGDLQYGALTLGIKLKI